MLTVATYLWFDPAAKHNAKYEYKSDDVRRLKRAVAKHLTVPHEFAVITDRPHMFDGDRDIRPIPIDWTKHVDGRCFVRLMTFHPKGAELIGERVLQIDLDTLIVGNMDPLVDRDEDVVLWRNPSRIPWDKPVMPGRPYYNTSMVMHRCGTLPHVWEKFKPEHPIVRDDQWWLSELLGPDMPYWDGSHGVYRLGRADTPGSGVVGELPENARVVTFPGSEGKWWEQSVAAANPWIKDFAA
jgi:hypothetical protein